MNLKKILSIALATLFSLPSLHAAEHLKKAAVTTAIVTSALLANGNQKDKERYTSLIDQKQEIDFKQWIMSIKLKDEHYNKLQENGYDTLEELQSTNKDELDELCRVCGIEFGYKAKFDNALKKLYAQNLDKHLEEIKLKEKKIRKYRESFDKNYQEIEKVVKKSKKLKMTMCGLLGADVGLLAVHTLNHTLVETGKIGGNFGKLIGGPFGIPVGCVLGATGGALIYGGVKLYGKRKKKRKEKIGKIPYDYDNEDYSKNTESSVDGTSILGVS